MKDDRLYLLHILECINRVQTYTADGEAAFYKDTKTQDAVLRNLQTLAESSTRLSAGIKEAHSEIDWKSISGFRNILVHDYFGIDVEEIWHIVSTDLPPLKNATQTMLSELGKPPTS